MNGGEGKVTYRSKGKDQYHSTCIKETTPVDLPHILDIFVILNLSTYIQVSLFREQTQMRSTDENSRAID